MTDPADPILAAPADPPPGRPLPLAALVAAAIVLLALAGIGGLAHERTSSIDLSRSPAMIAPEGVLDLARVPHRAAVEFRYVAEHVDHFREFRCWCGCEAAFDHRSLADCFLRPDGRWEAHGAGCGVCLAEARIAREALEAGTPPDRIAADLDARFGPDPTLPVGKGPEDLS